MDIKGISEDTGFSVIFQNDLFLKFASDKITSQHSQRYAIPSNFFFCRIQLK